MKQVNRVKQVNRTNRKVVVVDEADNRLGVMGIWEAHQGEGVKHRAVSVLLYDEKGRVLLQKRSGKKPLWPRCWSNTVCTHPYEGESSIDCAVRRLREEMGIEMDKDKLKEVYKLDYQAKYSNELSENEVTTVMVGEYGGEVRPNPDEAEESRWVGWMDLIKEIEKKPEAFTPWFRLIAYDERVRKMVWGE